MDKILISGTGRCGTTFLIKLFSFLDYNTGFTRDNYQNYIQKNCNSGMEKNHHSDEYVLKNPTFIQFIKNIVEDSSIRIKYMIISIRDYSISARSRVSHKKGAGGLWNANNEEEQILYYNKIMTNYLFYMVKYDINTIFIDFEKMISNPAYLYEKLKPILDENDITFERFFHEYELVSENSRPK